MAGDTNIGGLLFIAVITSSTNPDPQNDDLNLVAYQALTFEELPDVGTHGNVGVEQSIVTFNTWATLSEKQKGLAVGADVEVVMLDNSESPSNGLVAMKIAAGISNKDKFAFKLLFPSLKEVYYRGVVTAPMYGFGGAEDFQTVTFTVGINQEVVFGP